MCSLVTADHQISCVVIVIYGCEEYPTQRALTFCYLNVGIAITVWGAIEKCLTT